jgi:hypothetical protein
MLLTISDSYKVLLDDDDDDDDDDETNVAPKSGTHSLNIFGLPLE